MNKSKAVYWDNEWHEIIDCISCPHYDLEHDEDFPEKACMLVYHLHNIGKHLGLTACPLPLWRYVQRHTPEELPEENKRVELHFENGLKTTGVYDYSVKMWLFNVSLTGEIHGRISDDMKLVSWRYINE